MSTADIQRQYDHVIAAHYDRDPQGITCRTLDRALEHLAAQRLLAAEPPHELYDAGGGATPLQVLDLGVGTGLFLEKLRDACQRPVQPYGLDISAEMVEIARGRIPELVVAVDDAAHAGEHFIDMPFDLVCTHFITGFVPLAHLTPLVHEKLAAGGHWSFVGATSAAYPELQRKADSPVVKRMFGGASLGTDQLLTPADLDDVTRILTDHGFTICQAELFRPRLNFENFDSFMEFAYWGGWLTPFIEKLGLHEASRTVRGLLNALIFPIQDHHEIAVVLAKKPAAP
ncbi:MAG: class I SAM-dependent methyltransferase [Pirellulales bacterium]|nr:class I SAM-dependent methyltransferase [Planctomycetales bacterium]